MALTAPACTSGHATTSTAARHTGVDSALTRIDPARVSGKAL